MYYRALTVALGRIFHLSIALRASNFRVRIVAPREQKGSRCFLLRSSFSPLQFKLAEMMPLYGLSFN